MTQYLLAVHRDAVSNATITPVDVKRYFARIDEFNTEMHLSGRLVFGGSLEPSSAARAVRFEYGGTVMKRGPHLEINEHVRRIWVIVPTTSTRHWSGPAGHLRLAKDPWRSAPSRTAA